MLPKASVRWRLGMRMGCVTNLLIQSSDPDRLSSCSLITYTENPLQSLPAKSSPSSSHHCSHRSTTTLLLINTVCTSLPVCDTLQIRFIAKVYRLLAAKTIETKGIEIAQHNKCFKWFPQTQLLMTYAVWKLFNPYMENIFSKQLNAANLILICIRCWITWLQRYLQISVKHFFCIKGLQTWD